MELDEKIKQFSREANRDSWGIYHPPHVDAIIQNNIVKLENRAKEMGYEVPDEQVLLPAMTNRGDFRMHERMSKHNIILPPFKLHGIVPFENMRLVMSWGEYDDTLVVSIYDPNYQTRGYYHPHMFDDSPYICSLHFSGRMGTYLRKGAIDTILPYAMRVVTKGGYDGAHHYILGMPWCANCSDWLGKYIPDPMATYERWKEGHPLAGKYTLRGFKLEYRELHPLGNECLWCSYGDLRCPTCTGSPRSDLSKCVSCDENFVCKSHGKYSEGLCPKCHKNRRKSDG